jgi:hypothetical protein
MGGKIVVFAPFASKLHNWSPTSSSSAGTLFVLGATLNNGCESPTYNQTNGVASLLSFGGET